MEKKTRQFRETARKRESYDRKVRSVGYTRVISLGKIIPEDWTYVRMRILNQTPESIEVLFIKLMGRDNDTHDEKASEEGE